MTSFEIETRISSLMSYMFSTSFTFLIRTIRPTLRIVVQYTNYGWKGPTDHRFGCVRLLTMHDLLPKMWSACSDRVHNCCFDCVGSDSSTAWSDDHSEGRRIGSSLVPCSVRSAFEVSIELCRLRCSAAFQSLACSGVSGVGIWGPCCTLCLLEGGPIVVLPTFWVPLSTASRLRFFVPPGLPSLFSTTSTSSGLLSLPGLCVSRLSLSARWLSILSSDGPEERLAVRST